jgi:hypothetical protein
MLKYMRHRSCIAAARVTIDCLKALGIDAVPVPVKFVVEVKGLTNCYVSGVTAAERATARGSVQIGEDGWNGHLTVIADRRFFLDPSFDQAMIGLDIPYTGTTIPVLSIPKHIRPERMKLEFKGDLSDGNEVRVRYIALDNQEYKVSGAWNDEALPFIVEEILAHMRRER